MKRPFALFVFVVMPLVMIVSQAQFTVEQPFFTSNVVASGDITPVTLSASNWWLYTDLPTNGYQMPDVISGCWTDRIGGVLMTNNITGGVTHATNYNLGVYFQQGSGPMDVTNAGSGPLTADNNCTSVYIFRPTTTTDFLNLCWDIQTGGGFRLRRFTGGSWRAGIVGTEATCFADFAINKYYDIIVVRSGGNTITIYTNGVVSGYSGVTLANTTRPSRLGTGTSANTGIEAYIAEAMYFATNLTAAGISNVHYYATNKYHHTP